MNIIKNMFGFIVNQPIHKTLQDMKVIYIMALVVTFNWTDALLDKIPPLGADADAVIVGVYFANFAALISIFWKAINDIRKPHN